MEAEHIIPWHEAAKQPQKIAKSCVKNTIGQNLGYEIK
jgi:hypothetical protein